MDILTPVSEREWTLYHYYERKADAFTTFWLFCQKFTKKLVDGRTHFPAKVLVRLTKRIFCGTMAQWSGVIL
jgi:hypothetical protein